MNQTVIHLGTKQRKKQEIKQNRKSKYIKYESIKHLR